MKRLLLIPLVLFLACEDEKELPNELSLDWILLKSGSDTIFYVNSCDGYVDIVNVVVDYNDYRKGWNCNCDYDNQCGQCLLYPDLYNYVENCNGYNMCDNVLDDCFLKYESMDTSVYWSPKLWYKYKLYYDTDSEISIPSYIPNNKTSNCDYQCEEEEYFHPNCDTPIDTTIIIGTKSVLVEKLGWLDKDNPLGYITYLRHEGYLQTDGEDIDINDWEVLDYQRKD